jgi:glyoxylase-like metal-dependent hydrolase (beta-lactamase superfamily II)
VRLDAQTYELSEPEYWQKNVSYLLLGKRRALLYDTGPGLYSIRSVVQTLTQLPIIVIPSHLHFDHVGDVVEFSDVRLLDTAALRAQAHGSEFVETPGQFMLKGGTRYRFAGWVKDGQRIDLGGRTVTVLSTPGHTPDSMSIFDPSGKRLFTGDLINREASLPSVPGSDVHAMANSVHRLLTVTPHAELAYEAHSEQPFTRAELQQLASGIDAIAADHATSRPSCLGGIPMKRFDVGPFPVLVPAESGQVLQPLNTATETLDFLAKSCAR